MRRFEKISEYKNVAFELPKRASASSAGYDLAAIENILVEPKEIKLVPTGIKVKMPKNEVLLVFSRSSLAMKKGLMMSNGVGVIDADYYYSSNEGHIMIPLYNFTDKEVQINKGERLAQGVFTNYYKTVDEIDNNEIRLGGFGSSGL